MKHANQIPKPTVKRSIKKSLSHVKKDTWVLFSKYIRLRDCLKTTGCTSFGLCITCGKRYHLKLLQAGHFISRSYLATRWDTDNVKNQCVGCNIFGGGKPLDFEENLRSELGNKRVDALKKKRHEITILTPNWYEERIVMYKELLKNL